MVRLRLESQLLNGDGAAPNLRGILNVVGVQGQAKGADPTPDTIAKAMRLIETNGGYSADTIVLHPADWEAIRLLRTADGIYIWGSPADAGRASIWGLPVVVTSACPEGTGIVGAFKAASMLFFRSDMQIAVSDSHSDFFIRNQVMLRAEVRVAMACFRPTAFCLVTGI
jgi:HK97 family phage major capsid protein